MNASVARFGVLALTLAAASPAAAQLASTPVYFSPKGPRGLTLAADFGSTLQTKVDGVKDTDKPNAFSGQATIGLPIISIGVGAGVYDPKGGADKEVQFMGSAALKLFSPPLVPVGVSLQAGAGYLKQGSGTLAVKTISFPIGIGVAVKPSTPGASVEIWGAPRVHFQVVSAGGSSKGQAGIGGSAGVNLGIPTGLGLHAAVDYTSLSAKTAAGAGGLALPKLQSIVFGVGLHYTITIPGIPLAPVI